ncbi:zinc finger and SCAN domain-containing protein 29-like [Haliotis rubra]|uniref:zinc finger and SCAN domain-containing protein 29-like n=1 Tax=Haliotis rubra TaxID=36100 RepID=UPI001EE5F33F|nr:zinc finger and SCAN domain-containing protein 29-like [Haliotis rubra]
MTERVKRRGASWSDDETLALLNIWQELHVEESLDNPKTNNTSIYKTISSSLEDYGFQKTPEQCKVKMHTLKRSYRMWKGKLKKSGRGRSLCKHFEKLDEILGCRPASSPVKIIESSTTDKTHDDIDTDVSSDTEVGPDSEVTGVTGDTEADKEDKPLPSDHEQEPSPGISADNLEKDDALPKIQPPRKRSLFSAKDNEQSQSSQKWNKKAKKSKLEVVMTTVMSGFTKSNEKIEDKYVNLENRKIELEMKKLEMEKLKIETEKSNRESEERMQRETNQHQLNMILGKMGQGQDHFPWNFPSSMPGTSRGDDPGSDVSYDTSGSTYYNM